jgi:hypothetical protein
MASGIQVEVVLGVERLESESTRVFMHDGRCSRCSGDRCPDAHDEGYARREDSSTIHLATLSKGIPSRG